MDESPPEDDATDAKPLDAMSKEEVIEEVRTVRRRLNEMTALYDRAPVGYCTLDKDGRIREINLTAAALIGVPREELLGRAFTSVASLEHEDRFLAHMRACVQPTEQVVSELALTHRTGGIRTLRLVSDPVTDSRGIVTACRTAFIDITDLKELEERLRLLSDAGMLLTSQLDHRSALEAAAHSAVPAFADACAIDLRSDGAMERPIVIFADPVKQLTLADRVKQAWANPDRRTPVTEVLASGRAMVVSDVSTDEIARLGYDEEYGRMLQAAGVRSFIVVPLTARGRTFGSLTLVEAESNRHYASADLPFAQDLANRMALALDNARLYEEAWQTTQKLRNEMGSREQLEHERLLELAGLGRLHRVSALYLGDKPSSQILEEVLDAAIAITEADSGIVQILDTESSKLEIVSHRGLPDWWLDFWKKVPLDVGAFAASSDRRKRVIAEDVASDPSFVGTEAREVQLKAGIRALQSTPLIGRNATPLGMISTHFRKPHRPNHRSLRLLDLLASETADVLERFQTENALRLSEAKFSGILSISADAVIVLDSERRIALWNDGAGKIFGYDREEVLGRPIEMLMPERFRERHREHVARFANGPDGARRMGERDLEIFGRRKNGEEFPADAAIAKLHIESQTILTVTVRDATKQKRIESDQRLLAETGQLLASRLDYEETITRIVTLMAQNLADVAVLYIRGEDGAIRRARAVTRDPSLSWFADLLLANEFVASPGHPACEVIATKHSVLKEADPSMLSSLAHSEEHLRALRSIELKSVMAVPLLTGDVCLGALLLESSTRDYVPDDLPLAEEIGRRTALLIENANLHRTARRAIHARDDVLAIVAHDLRNPLGAIVMEADFLQSGEYAATHGPKDSGAVLERSAKRMMRLIRDLLDATRIETGELSLDRSQVGVADAVADFAKSQEALVSSKGIELRVDIAPDVGKIVADRDRLFQALENLVGNAVKFTERDGRITIGAAPKNGEVLFRVEDTGAGIAKEALPFLFDRYSEEKKTEQAGTGLGLPIVKGIVDAHGGKVRVESRVGEGTSISFTIPRGTSDENRA